MPFDDRELDMLAGQRDQAWNWLQTCRTQNSQAYELLRDAKDRYGSQIERLKSANQQLTSRIQDAQRRQQLCRRTRDYSGADSLRYQISDLRREREQNNDARQSCTAAIRDARNRLDGVRSDLESAKRAFEQAKFAFKERLEYLKAESRQHSIRRATQQAQREHDHQRRVEKLGGFATDDALARTRGGWGKHKTQDRTEEVHTKVRAGYDEDSNSFTSDFIIADRDQPGHVHHVIDEYGNVIYDQWEDR